MENKKIKDKKISASEARHQADTTHALSNHIYKKIDEGSGIGLCRLEWGVWGYSITLVNDVAVDLKSSGYNVTFNYDTDNPGAAMINVSEKEDVVKKLVSITITW